MNLRTLTQAAASVALIACGRSFMDFPDPTATELARDAAAAAADAGTTDSTTVSTTVACPSPPCMARLVIAAGVDGTTDLVLKGDTIRWHHFKYVPPNRTTINGEEWLPEWPPDPVGRECESSSTTFAPALPARAQTVSVSRVRGRLPVRADSPSQKNDFTLTVHFNDVLGGPDDYEILIEFEQ